MHLVEPYYAWRDLYIASEDEYSPFSERVYSEFHFEHKVYNYLIHPQWDSIGSETLFIKVLFTDYENGYAIIEMIGEWNDTIENDVMTLKRDIIDNLIKMGITKYILIGENVLNFHSSDDCYYEEWIEDIEDGWVALINFHEHVEFEMESIGIDQYFLMGGDLIAIDWRTYLPKHLFKYIDEIVSKRLE